MRYILEQDRDEYGNLNPFGLIIFLPENLDKSNLIDISTIGSRFAKFLDITTNKIHDCEKYYKAQFDDKKE